MPSLPTTPTRRSVENYFTRLRQRARWRSQRIATEAASRSGRRVRASASWWRCRDGYWSALAVLAAFVGAFGTSSDDFELSSRVGAALGDATNRHAIVKAVFDGAVAASGELDQLGESRGSAEV